MRAEVKALAICSVGVLVMLRRAIGVAANAAFVGTSTVVEAL